LIRQILFIVFISVYTVSAQTQDTTDEYTLRRSNPSDSYERRVSSTSDAFLSDKKVFYGGNLGLMLGSFTNIMLNPRINIYESKVSSILGTGLMYQYIHDRIWNVRYNIAGVNFLVHKLLYNTLFVGVEYEMLRIWSGENFFWSYPFMIGGGYITLGQDNFYSIGLFYPVHQGANQVYPNSIIFRFNIGF
jgi:hypothetical protein